MILISFEGKSVLNIGILASRIPISKQHKKKMKMWLIGAYIGVSVVVFGSGIAILGAILVNRWKQKREISNKATDLELQQLSLSIRTTSEKKVSFDRGSQDTLDGQVIESTPRNKMLIEIYTFEELKKATEDFNSINIIEESVFHGRLNGKDLAIKRAKNYSLSKINFALFHDTPHFHPNIIRLVGICSSGGNETYLVFEYAKNGSLKDWIHGGLAMKSQFISSCYCFLNWNQRLKICLDVATALQYMHQVMIPSYVHSNIKSQNIFLDEEFNAKIGNFGIGKSSEGKPSPWTFWSEGYLAPEYLLQNGTISPSIDIFAFGVVLLEVLSGKTPITRCEGRVWLSKEIRTILENENDEELRGWMDNDLGENYSFDGAVTMANLARACVDDDPCLRPSSGEIVEKLSRLVEDLPDLSDPFSVCDSSVKPLVKSTRN